jgi:hypothetical protein
MKRAAPTKAAILLTAMAGALLVGLVLFQQRTRVIEGTWIDLFEGSRFFEGEGISTACGPKFMGAPWFAYYPNVNSAAGKLIRENRNSGVFLSEDGRWPVAAYSVKFEGYHQIVGFGFGHLSASPSEYVVDRMISIKPIASPKCDIRPG